MKLFVVIISLLGSLAYAEDMLNTVSFDHDAIVLGHFALSEDKVMHRLRVQIQTELTASYLYQAYAARFGRADVALPGFRKHFSEASMEEREHAEKLIDYINKRGGHQEFFEIDFMDSCAHITNELRGVFGNTNDNLGCLCYQVGVVKNTKKIPKKCETRSTHGKHGLHAIQDMLAMERLIYTSTRQLLVESGRDPVLSHILEHEYLTRQVHGIKHLANHVTRLQRFLASGEYSVGEFMVDREFQGTKDSPSGMGGQGAPGSQSL